MRLLLCFVFIAVVAPCAASAQTNTADGILALVRGDYQTAARILRPLADEDSPQSDPLAQYFLAMLFDAGQGVPRNAMRACGLYLSAARPANPLMNQSFDLARSMRSGLGFFAERLCSNASADRWRDAPAASFTLGPGHSITIDETGATILFKGNERFTTMVRSGGPGFVYLPVVHTLLDVSRPVEARRHFIQFFTWSPYRPFDTAAWTLWWSLSEVVGPDLIPVTTNESLMTITAPQPPMPFDVDGAAGVRADASGEAEWVVRGGPNPRSGLIPFRGPR
jgi:hypothetical protein